MQNHHKLHRNGCTLKIGSHTISNSVILAPMAGVTDLPFRQLVRDLGAGLVISEMVTSDSRLWNTRKSRLRLAFTGEPEPRAVQIVGGDPQMMSEAAYLNEKMGAQIIDINMGCPAKKVCNKLAGSALLKDERLVSDILKSVVSAVNIPVTLKIRTGWSPEHRNGLTIAKIAEDAGIIALSVHGRTRSCRFGGEAEYDTIARIKQSVQIPVIANGDIDSPEKAKAVLDYTSANAIMVGRVAQGNPWIFREIEHYLKTGEKLPAPDNKEIESVLLRHLNNLYLFYGEYMGVRIARKHLGWYFKNMSNHAEYRCRFNVLESPFEQKEAVKHFVQHLVY